MVFRGDYLLAQLVAWGLRESCAECGMEGADGDYEMVKMPDRLTNGGCQGYSGGGRVVERQSWVGSGVEQVGWATQLLGEVFVEMVYLVGVGLPRQIVVFDLVLGWGLAAMWVARRSVDWLGFC